MSRGSDLDVGGRVLEPLDRFLGVGQGSLFGLFRCRSFLGGPLQATEQVIQPGLRHCFSCFGFSFHNSASSESSCTLWTAWIASDFVGSVGRKSDSMIHCFKSLGNPRTGHPRAAATTSAAASAAEQSSASVEPFSTARRAWSINWERPSSRSSPIQSSAASFSKTELPQVPISFPRRVHRSRYREPAEAGTPARWDGTEIVIASRTRQVYRGVYSSR